jgi:two-component system invasion response regulator UvrY
MSYRVLIYSYHSIIQIGLSYCVKKSVSNASIVSKTSLIEVFENNLDFDLYIFYTSKFSEMSYINEKFSLNLKGQKVVLLIDDLEYENLLHYKDVVYIHKDSCEKEIINCLRVLTKNRKRVIRYKSITKKIQNKHKFSRREQECANLFMKGYSVSQISKELSIKMNTVSTYKMRMHEKTSTTNLVQLIRVLYSLKD